MISHYYCGVLYMGLQEVSDAPVIFFAGAEI